MKYLIIGHPRCGTGFMSKLFKKNGLDVGHEVMGNNGTSDWQYAILNEKCFPWTTAPRSAFKFETIIHNIRDPFTAIPSIVYTETPNLGEQSWRTVSEQFRRKYVRFPDTNVFENAAHSYLGWNKIIEDQKIANQTVRIEHVMDDLEVDDIKESLGNKKVNSRPHGDMTKENWNKIPSNIIDMLEAFCKKHNYESLKERISKLD